MMFGLIGYPLGHSRSQAMFNAWGYEYENFPVEELNECTFRELLDQHPTLTGLNVTIPHKQTVMPLLDEIDGPAAEIGAVNTVRIERDEGGKVLRTKGYNTDVIGFGEAVKELLGPETRGALILGTGGASLAAAAACKSAGIDVLRVSRTPGKDRITYADIDAKILGQYSLIVNATPLGMYPKVEACPPIPYELLSEANGCFDMVYNPATTEFMRRCAERGAKVKNGLEMLEGQALAALKIWTS